MDKRQLLNMDYSILHDNGVELESRYCETELFDTNSYHDEESADTADYQPYEPVRTFKKIALGLSGMDYLNLNLNSFWVRRLTIRGVNK